MISFLVQIGTKVELAQFGSTRILTLSPFYMINNTTRVCESIAAQWELSISLTVPCSLVILEGLLIVKSPY